MNQISICILCWLHPDSWCLNPSELAKHLTSRGRNRDQDGYSRDCGEFSERPGDCFGDQSGMLGIPTCWICIWWNIGWVFYGMPQLNMKCMKCPQKDLRWTKAVWCFFCFMQDFCNFSDRQHPNSRRKIRGWLCIISREVSDIFGHPNVRHLGSKLCAPWFLQRSFHNGLLDVSWLCRNERVHVLRTTSPFARPRILK